MVSKLKTAFKNIKVIVVTELLLMIVMVSTIVVKADAINERYIGSTSIKLATLKTISSDNNSGTVTGTKATISQAETERDIKVAEDKRTSIISFAKQFIGKPYVLGGKSLTNGCDCASFITLIYKEYGYNWKMGSVNTLYDNCGGTTVSVDDMKPGDIIFFGRGNKRLHVAMYAGNGRIVHAMDPSHDICEIDLYRPGTKTTYSGKSILEVKRIIN